MIETRPFDPTRHIATREDAAMYVDVALETGDMEDLVDALDVVARALGEAEPRLSPEAGLAAVSIALETLGLRLGAQERAEAAKAA